MKKRPAFLNKNQTITIPKHIRDEQGLQPGDCFDFEVLPDGSLKLSRKECCHTPAFEPICKIAKKSRKN